MMKAPETRCGSTLFQRCTTLASRRVFHFDCGLEDFDPPATIQELGEGCRELLGLECLRRYEWLDGDRVQITIHESIEGWAD